MSQENVEVVRKHIEAFRQGDASGALSYLDRHVVLDRSRVRGPDFGVAYGHDAVNQTMRNYMGAFEEYDYELERLTDVGSGAVLAVVNEEGRGKTSGAPVRHSYAMLYTVIDAKIVRCTLFPSEDQALKAAGLKE
jgi:ketosteroid isomerase-like protein